MCGRCLVVHTFRPLRAPGVLRGGVRAARGTVWVARITRQPYFGLATSTNPGLLGPVATARNRPAQHRTAMERRRSRALLPGPRHEPTRERDRGPERIGVRGARRFARPEDGVGHDAVDQRA